jgi:hypothetical protein
MKRLIVKSILLTTLGLTGLSLSACGQINWPTTGRWNNQSTTGFVNDGGVTVHYHAIHLTFEERTYLVMLVKGGDSAFIATEGSRISGELALDRDRKTPIKWSSDYAENQGGVVTIGDQTFDLAEGFMLLIDAKSPTLKIEQVPIDQPKGVLTSDIKKAIDAPPDFPRSLRKLSVYHSKVADFLKELPLK